ncbi:GGDEF domain-containing response regulator [Arenimonas sp. MALMAid1274]|uniref:GGDEF domain-containing response regulator n=1 Tax=Arenimonas sp. MALMAid1274 TaxID=3411630 RepID=UPI003BA2B5E4
MDGGAPARSRILVVDDSRLMRKAAQKMLGDEFDLATAEDGEDAWEQIKADDTLQVVFTDLNMPRCTGYELLARIRGSDDPGVQALPVIIVTGAENDEAARMQALDMGATDFITKPFTTTDLVARARAHANNRRITRQLQAQSTLDPLTGLANKAGFLDRLQQDIAYARRHQQPMSLVRLEIEDFRRFFLYQGRDVAERLVQQVAKLLRARIRKEDTAARIGLGGFALSLPGGELIGIGGMLERLRSELAANLPVGEDGQAISVVLQSAVVSPDTADATDASALMDQCTAQLASPQADTPASVAATEAAASASPVEASGAAAPMPPSTVESTAAVAPAASAAATETLRLDPLIDALVAGNARPAQEKLPQIIGRLLPILRLLGPNQRAQLIQFLQRLG